MHPDGAELVGAIAHQVSRLDDVGVDDRGAGRAHQVATVIGDVVGEHALEDADQGQLVGALPVFGLAPHDQLLRIVACEDGGEIRNAPGLGAHVAGGDLAARANLLHLDGIGRIVVHWLRRIVAEVLPAGHVDRAPAHGQFRRDRRVGKQDPGLVDLERLDVLLERVLRVDRRDDRVGDAGVGVCHFVFPLRVD